MGDLHLPGHRPRRRRPPSPPAASASASRRCASTATTTSPCTPSPQWAVERARAQPRADADRVGHLPRRRPLDLRRPLRLPPEDRVRRLAARRPGRSAEEPPDRHRRLVRRAPQAGRGRDPRRGGRRAEGGRERTARCSPAASPRPATCSRTSSPTCRRTCAASASRRGSDDAAHDDDRGDPQRHGRRDGARRDAWSSSARTSATSAACSAAPHGLQQKYGSSRCFDAPINERGIVGAADRHGRLRPAAVRRDPVRRLHLSRLRPDRLRGGAPALPLGRRVHLPDRHPHADRRRHLRRPDPQPEPGGAVHPRLRPEGRRARPTRTTPRAC